MSEEAPKGNETAEEHCLRRLKERYGLVVGPWYLDRLERIAKNGGTTVIGDTQTIGRVHCLQTRKQKIYFLTDVRSGRITTILDEKSASAMAVRKVRVDEGRERGDGHRGEMADQLDSIRSRLFGPVAVGSGLDIREQSVDGPERDVRERSALRIREGE